jgi:glycosyltransferase involved in cell wall biosynthesis
MIDSVLPTGHNREEMPLISIVLPCLNESETLEICIRKSFQSISQLGISGEVIVSDNGSTDNSKEIALRNGARLVEVKTKGYGAALHSGFKFARGKFVIMADADDSYALDRLEPFYEALMEGADFVIGNRFAGGIEKDAMPFLHKYLGNPVLSWIARKFFGGNIRDYHCGLRAFNKEKVLNLDLRSPGMEFASELIVKAQLHDLKIVQVPTTLKKDGRSRPPHLKTWSDGFRHLRFLLSYSPRWLFLYPGLLVLIPSCLFFLRLSIGSFTIFGVTFATATLIYVSCLLIVSFQIIWFSILAKASSISKGLLPTDKSWTRIINFVMHLRMTLLGVILLSVGCALSVMYLKKWETEQFGPMDTNLGVRQSLFAVINLAVGAQIIFGQVLVSIISIKGKENSD